MNHLPNETASDFFSSLLCTFFDTISPTGAFYPDFLNLDLTATKKFGKWELGPVAFGSTDLPTRNPTYLRQGQFAVGGSSATISGP